MNIREMRARTRTRAEGILRNQGLPIECERCGGKPGHAGCGKVIHIELEAAWNDARAELEGEWPDGKELEWPLGIIDQDEEER